MAYISTYRKMWSELEMSLYLSPLMKKVTNRMCNAFLKNESENVKQGNFKQFLNF